MNKKAVEQEMLILIAKLFIIVVSVTFLVGFTYKLESKFLPKQTCHDTSTISALEDINNQINNLKLPDFRTSLITIPDKSCLLIGFDKVNDDSGITKPAVAECIGSSCLCFCEQEDSSCKEKPLCKQFSDFDKIDFINFNKQYIKADNSDQAFDITLKKEVNNRGEPVVYIINGAAENIQEVAVTEAELPQEDAKIIYERISKYDSFIKEANDKYPNVPISLIKAVIARESHGNFDVVSPKCGAAGLMQLMPGVAKNYGINVLFEDSSIIKCDSDYASRLITARDSIETKYFGEDQLNQLYLLDGRFDQEKDIMAGTSYLSTLLKNPLVNGNITLVLAAYNGGTCGKDAQGRNIGALCPSITCPGKMYWNCEYNLGYKETRDYVNYVTAYNQEFTAIATA